MPTFDLTELDKLERRERQLTILAAVVVLVMAAGMALLMYPLVLASGSKRKSGRCVSPSSDSAYSRS